ncbi:anti-sigma regulatory factor (Ser/Thr protein kinase) [Actinoplanes octamycinicus]|uniref:Anti-sigma regulatory factor (Ser/Thr protein kinase) n=1 Tax=Actinoplanes octamycinicus TaxID=135948 RepID=A0A7W7H159_9ACTN|nr:ATP-binding protein [Actinoplanes octamycinicus]MBB4741998.1 anti-sigma regulatory factor (Ser/Thr protein kinase) [Actinoplanes octamycinicus]GIE60761.1 hypothetical protein Aoc01nite_61630 [Actinoplanes octamycinicus]
MSADSTSQPGDALPGSPITAVKDERTAIVELAVTGTWDHRLWEQADQTWQECLAEHPTGLLLDLSYLDDPDARSAALWHTVQAHGSRMQPPVPVAVCLRPGTPLAVRLGRPDGDRGLPVYLDLDQARHALAISRPRTEQVRAMLAPDPASAAVARELVTAACREWALEPLLPYARLVASELVTNAAEHAGTTVDLVVTRLGPQQRGKSPHQHYLHLAVYDRSPELPRPVHDGDTLPDGALTLRGVGLHVVGQAAWTWGALPTRTGKVVWATIRQPPP